MLCSGQSVVRHSPEWSGTHRMDKTWPKLVAFGLWQVPANLSNSFINWRLANRFSQYGILGGQATRSCLGKVTASVLLEPPNASSHDR